MNVVEFRNAIMEAATEADKILNDPHSDDPLLLIIDDGNDGEVLVLGFNDEAFPRVVLNHSMTETMVKLAMELRSFLEKNCEELRMEFRDEVEASLDEIRNMADISKENIEDWADTFESIAKRCREFSDGMDTEKLDNSETLANSVEALETATQDFMRANGLEGLVFLKSGGSRIEPVSPRMREDCLQA